MSFYIIEISTIMIAVLLLATGLAVRKSGNRELDRVLQITLFVGLLSGLTLFFEYYLSTLAGPLNSYSVWLTAFISAILSCAREFLTLLIIVFWNMFVDYSMYKSYDHVRKKLKKSLILVSLVSGIFTVLYATAQVYSPIFNLPVIIWNTFYILSLVIQVLYVINAIWIVWSGKNMRKPPTFLRLDLFLIPIAVGYTLYLIPGVPDIRNLSYAVAAGLTFITLMKRGRYVDAVTGFYNKTFLRSMNEYMEKHGYPNGTGVYFKAKANGAKLIPVLENLKPSDAEIFFIGENEYLLMSGPQKESVLKLLIKTVKLKAAAEDSSLEIDTAYAIREKEETAEDFTKRLLELTPAV